MYAYAELHTDATKRVATPCLRRLIAAVPYKMRTVVTDNGIPFTNRRRDHEAFRHLFARVCRAHGIEPRLTKVHHPWTTGQVDRMNRTLKEAPVKTYYDQTHQHLKHHLHAFQMGTTLPSNAKHSKA